MMLAAGWGLTSSRPHRRGLADSFPIMNPEAMNKLARNDQRAMVIAMHVRNAMEDIHADPEIPLTDEVMERLNKTTRRAIWEVLEAMDKHPDADPDALKMLTWTAIMVPDYWEPPSELPSPFDQ
jgi:hypothetical protein